ncbi:MAG: NAD(P)H-dependent oxidoreductase [Verrucomicrobia bacterium]|nr:NAD(P)H-dependent oxidoreductase [Verrucomicrobiota bacterium]
MLYIEASPRKSRSNSIEVSQVFLSELKNAHPSIEVDKLDLWATELPAFDGYTGRQVCRPARQPQPGSRHKPWHPLGFKALD